MEALTTLVLIIQLLALCSIAGALLLYLLCKVRNSRNAANGGVASGSTGPTPQQGAVLITSADTALGLQLCTHLALRGCRVFAGMKDPVDSLPAKLIRAWTKIKKEEAQTYNNRTKYDAAAAAAGVPPQLIGTIVPLCVDVTREDVLKEATESMGAHLNAGERGIRAVINTAGCVYRGRIENQDAQQWEQMFKMNVLGSLRAARAFSGLLRPTRGRLIYFGAGNDGDGLVAFSAARVAVEGCVSALRTELQPYGISVVALDTHGVPTDSLYRSPIPFNPSAEVGTPTQYSAEVLTSSTLGVIEKALWDTRPNDRYHLAVPNVRFCNFMPNFRKSFKWVPEINRGVQKV